jgi:NTE family protein
MNGVVLCDGIVEGGEEGARAALRRFWEGIARAGENNPFRGASLAAFMSAAAGPWSEAVSAWWSAFARSASPYDFNPHNLNPIGDVLDELVDFARVQRCSSLRLFVAATNVETGRARIFTNAEMTARHVLASACVPQLFHAVEIEGAYYWDGGYMGNPPLFPLFTEPVSRDVVIVQINPIERPGAPRSAGDIAARVNEITFNASLLRELRAVEFVARLLDKGLLLPGRYNKMLIHVVNDDEALLPLGAQAKLNTDLAFFERLFAIGRASAARWLDAHFADLGARGTVDLRKMFEGEMGPIAPFTKN